MNFRHPKNWSRNDPDPLTPEQVEEGAALASRLEQLEALLKEDEVKRPRPAMGLTIRNPNEYRRLEALLKQQPEEGIRQALIAEEREARERLAQLNGIRSENSARLESLEEVGMGARLRAGIHEAKDTTALKAVREWWASDSWALLLLGSTGSGKTFAAGWAMNELCKKTSNGVWLSCVDASLSPIYGDDASRALKSWRYAQLLVFDDLGTEHQSGPWQSVFFQVMDWRYSDMRRTIVTTNLSADELKARYSERFADRIREGGWVRSCGGASLRRATH